MRGLRAVVQEAVQEAQPQVPPIEPYMVMYNTLMGLMAGYIMWRVTVLWRDWRGGKNFSPIGHAMSLLVPGVVLLPLSLHMTLTHPLTANRPLNIAFGEPCLVLSVLAIVGALYLILAREKVASGAGKVGWTEKGGAVLADLKPVGSLVAVQGLAMLAFAIAIFRFELVGGAPFFEPITGRLGDWPWVENTFFGLLYLLPAIAMLLIPSAIRTPDGRIQKFAGLLLWLSGWGFMLFSALNGYTHIGLLKNMILGVNRYLW